MQSRDNRKYDVKSVSETFFYELTGSHQFILCFFSGGIKTLPLKTAYRLYVQTHLTGDRSADHKRYVSVGSLNLSNLIWIWIWKKIPTRRSSKNMTTCFRHDDEWKVQNCTILCKCKKAGSRTAAKSWNSHTDNITASDLWPLTRLVKLHVSWWSHCCELLLINVNIFLGGD